MYVCIYIYIYIYIPLPTRVLQTSDCTRAFYKLCIYIYIYIYIRRSFVYPHRCTLPSQHAQHFHMFYKLSWA